MNIQQIPVLVRQLAGGSRSAVVLAAAVGKTIAALRLDDDALHFEFSDGSKMKLSDEGQSCCEVRYMRTDDTLPDYIGATLLGAEVAGAPNVNDDTNDPHEVQFLRVQTDRGTFVMSNHNEHNGYYGGFWIEASEE